MVEENFWNLTFWNAPEQPKFTELCSPWLKKILKFDFLKLPQIGSILLLFCHNNSVPAHGRHSKIRPRRPRFFMEFRPRGNSPLKFDFLKRPQNGSILLLFLHSHTFTMVEESFEIRISETPQNGSILLLFFHSHTFTMVDENFEIRISETSQNGSILLLFFHSHTFTTVDMKILKFDILKRSRMAQFYYNSVIVIPLPWLKKILKFYFLERLKMAQLYYFSEEISISSYIQN